MLERNARPRLVLFEPGKKLQEYLLGQVLFAGRLRQVAAHNANDHRVERLHQRASRVLILAPCPFEAPR
jgi:hypothetical protein